MQGGECKGGCSEGERCEGSEDGATDECEGFLLSEGGHDLRGGRAACVGCERRKGKVRAYW